ncbi:MAG: hypothetical protein ISR50_08800 [Alphaproteobacteria bacterium]|nr:hypothetical protein [Alphaproteobacteria bacterium]
MPTEQIGKTRIPPLLRRWPETARILIGLGLGLALLWLATPRTMAAFLSLPGDPVLQAMQTDGPVTSDDLRGFIASRENALAWIDAGRTWTDLSLGYLRLAGQTGDDGTSASNYLEISAKALKTGLSKAPANPYAWARLSYLDLRLEGAGRDAKNSLNLSLFTGPYERLLAESRIEYALAVWYELTVTQQALVHDQIVFLDRFDRRRLLGIIRQNRNAKVIALTALAPYPERQAAVRAALKKK